MNRKGNLVKQINTTEQIVLPQKYHHVVYKELHENMGHLEPERVIELCRQRFYWPGYEKDITHYIRKKCKCVKEKNPNKQQTAPLQSIITHEPFELVTIDFLHLDRSKGGYEYLLVVVDHFSKFVQAFLTKTSLRELLLVYCLINIFSILDFWNIFSMTKERNSVNLNISKCLSEIIGVKPSRTTPCYPMGNALCERMNRPIINMLKTLPTTFKSNWKNHIQKLTFAYNI